jgi:hypothetical protein
LAVIEKIKVGICVAYDWYLLEHALPPIYKDADLICLSLDRNRRSWSGKDFTLDENSFREFVRQHDPDGKIKIYEDDFSIAKISPAENEVRQRMLMASFMGTGGWHIQIDCDEYFLNFAGFVEYLHSLSFRSDKINVLCPLLTLFKKVDGGYLVINSHDAKTTEYVPVATRYPHYEFGRKNGYFNIYTNYVLVHQSWARTPDEIVSKLRHWGHSKDFDPEKYTRFWQVLNASNFQTVSDFHPIEPKRWSSLRFVAAADETDLLKNLSEDKTMDRSRFDLLITNSKFVSRVLKLLRLGR